MRQFWISCILTVLTLSTNTPPADSQGGETAVPNAEPYRLNVSVNEVILTFHAADSHGNFVDDLKVDELRLLDSGTPPLKISAFDKLQNLPIRAGILMDMSESMDLTRSSGRAIAIEYAQQLLRQHTDMAFVVTFDRWPRVTQPLTGNTSALIDAIRNQNVKTRGVSRAGGTAVIDAVHRACLDQFGHVHNATTGNIVLLFSDGEDNASSYSLQETVDLCQRNNIAIYSFRDASQPSSASTGSKTLTDLASQTGGRVFRDDDTEDAVSEDLRIIEADLRNQYRLVYRPVGLKHDGSFHPIVLIAPERVARITTRSGYYATAH